jgi:hypothetical protein
MDDNPLSRSRRLASPKFDGLTAQHLSGAERVVLADDCHAEIFELSGTMKPHYDLAAVLTDARLLLFRGRGITGPKKPWTVELGQIDECGVTRQGNTNVKFKGENGFPGLWKLVFNDERQADLWAASIAQAGQALASGSAPQPADEGPDDAQLQRLHNLLDALRPFATPDRLRRPFGKGHGLDEAMQAVFQQLQSPEDARVCGDIMMVEMLVSARDDRVADDALEIMGATEEAAMRHQTGSAPNDIGVAAIALLQQHRGPGGMWDLWQRRDDVVVEMLCWHSIARLRLATAGLMDPVTRP